MFLPAPSLYYLLFSKSTGQLDSSYKFPLHVLLPFRLLSLVAPSPGVEGERGLEHVTKCWLICIQNK
jgi:hypothetical protein